MADNGSSRWNGNYGSEETKRRSLYDISKPRGGQGDTLPSKVKRPMPTQEENPLD